MISLQVDINNKRTVGVYAVVSENQNVYFSVSREVILSGGAINSPQVGLLYERRYVAKYH